MTSSETMTGAATYQASRDTPLSSFFIAASNALSAHAVRPCAFSTLTISLFSQQNVKSFPNVNQLFGNINDFCGNLVKVSSSTVEHARVAQPIR